MRLVRLGLGAVRALSDASKASGDINAALLSAFNQVVNKRNEAVSSQDVTIGRPQSSSPYQAHSTVEQATQFNTTMDSAEDAQDSRALVRQFRPGDVSLCVAHLQTYGARELTGPAATSQRLFEEDVEIRPYKDIFRRCKHNADFLHKVCSAACPHCRMSGCWPTLFPRWAGSCQRRRLG